MVLCRLGRHRLSDAQAARFPRSRLSGRVLRHDRDQHVVLSAPPSETLRAVAGPRGGQPAVRVHREALAEVYARNRSHCGRRAGSPSGLRSAAAGRKARSGLAAVSVLLPLRAGECCLSEGTARATYGLSVSRRGAPRLDRKSTRLNSSHVRISYAVFCLKKKKHYIHDTEYDV